ncbi:heat-stable enterotoxin EAST1 [Escherichia coli]
MFILTFQNHTNRPLTDFGGKTSIFSHPVYLFLREFSLQDFRGGSTQYIRRPASSYASCIWCATACASCHGRTTKPSLAT